MPPSARNSSRPSSRRSAWRTRSAASSWPMRRCTSRSRKRPITAMASRKRSSCRRALPAASRPCSSSQVPFRTATWRRNAEGAGRHHRGTRVHEVQVAHQRGVDVGGDAPAHGRLQRRLHGARDLLHVGRAVLAPHQARAGVAFRAGARAVEAALVVVEAAARRVPLAAHVDGEVALRDDVRVARAHDLVVGMQGGQHRDAEHVVGVEGAAVRDDARAHRAPSCGDRESRSRSVRATTLVARRRSSSSRRSSARLACDSSTVRGPAP